MVAESGHYPQSQQPEITNSAIISFLALLGLTWTFRGSSNKHD